MHKRNRAIIVHGWTGSSSSDFLPWAKEELEKLDAEIIIEHNKGHFNDMPQECPAGLLAALRVPR